MHWVINLIANEIDDYKATERVNLDTNNNIQVTMRTEMNRGVEYDTSVRLKRTKIRMDNNNTNELKWVGYFSSPTMRDIIAFAQNEIVTTNAEDGNENENDNDSDEHEWMNQTELAEQGGIGKSSLNNHILMAVKLGVLERTNPSNRIVHYRVNAESGVLKTMNDLENAIEERESELQQ